MAKFEKSKSITDAANSEAENSESKTTGGNAFLKLPYGLAKDRGLSTEGMTPREVWELLKGKGIDKDEEERKFIDRKRSNAPRAKQDEPENFFEDTEKEEYSYTPPNREYKHKDVIEKYGIKLIYNPNTNRYDGLQLNKSIKGVPAEEIAYLKSNRDEIAKEVNQIKSDREYDEFYSKKQRLHGYSHGISGADYLKNNYDKATLAKTFEKYRYDNPDYDPWDDGYTYPYAFPEMEPQKLIAALDESKAEIQREKAAAEKQKTENMQAKFNEAAKTGKPVIIKTEGGANQENFDRGWAWVTTTYAMPDGTTKIEKTKDIWD